MIIWITGISGAGKTTLALEVLNKLREKHENVVNLDGDIIRDLFGNDLNYDIKSRIIQIKRLQKLSLFLQSQNIIVVVSALYSSADLLNWNRRNFKNYFEIYLEVSLEIVMKRDIKGIYKRFKEGKEKNIVGIDIPWNPPLNFDLKINMDKAISIKDTMNIISKKLNIF